MDEAKVIEAIEENVESLVPPVVETVNAVKNNPLLLGGVALGTLVVGALGGYFFAKKRLTLKYEQIAEAEIAEAKRFYSGVRKDQFPTPADAVAALVPGEVEKAQAKYKGDMKLGVVEVHEDEKGVDVRVMTRTQEPPKLVKSNIFVDGEDLDPDEFDYEVEKENRSSDAPYIISLDEFEQNEPENDKVTLTFYEADDILANDQEEPILDSDDLVGDENLTKFGHGSGDPNVLYVRNEEKDVSFEIIRDKGSYAQSVHGIMPKDSRKSIRKFRGDDE